MEKRILETASQLFLTHGFKSVTMDEIASKMAISKKTIYEYYKNKITLIKATTHFVFERVSERINSICDTTNETSPIQTLFDIDRFLLECLKEDNVAEYQLQKHYPKIYKSLDEKKFTLITEGISENLERGIALGFYRDDINTPIIARFYYAGSISVKHSEIFSTESYKLPEIMHTYLLYHIRAIATPKGLIELDRIIKTLNLNKKN